LLNALSIIYEDKGGMTWNCFCLLWCCFAVEYECCQNNRSTTSGFTS